MVMIKLINQLPNRILKQKNKMLKDNIKMLV